MPDTTMPSRFDEFSTASATLGADGWCLLPGLLLPSQTRALASECRALREAHLLRPARVGSDRDSTLLRGDDTRWFEPDALSGPQQVFAARIDALRVALSRQLLLGLVDCESHYAVYRPGSGYARHLDCLRGDDARVVSAVFYLNADWHEAEGGALRLYLGDTSYRDVYPQAGTLLLFLSAQFEHEVLPATRDRLSIACWMRQRARSRAT
jgi:SM-20-related protein